MTSPRIVAGLLAVSAVVVLSFLFVKTRSIDFEEHSEYTSGLLMLQEIDATLNQDILRTRYGIVGHYDPLVLDLAELKAVQTSLKKMPGFIDEAGRAEISAILDRHVRAVAAKEGMIERFKSQNAILRNSLQYVPILVASLAADASSGAEGQADELNDLLRDLLLFSIGGDADRGDRIRQRVDDLLASNDRPAADESGRSLDILAGHARAILDTKPLVDSLISDMMLVPTATHGEDIYRVYNLNYEQALRLGNMYRFFLYVVCVLLAACILYVFAKLRRATEDLRQANEQLEDRVEDRTRELQEVVGQLRALGEVGQAVSSTLDLQQVLTKIVAHAVELSGTDGGAIYAYDEADESFRLRATHGTSEELKKAMQEAPFRLNDPIVGQATLRREAAQIPDLLEGPDFYLRATLERAGFRAMLAVPLLLEDRIVGSLVVRRREPGEFDRETVDLLERFATQSALALQNARLFEEIEAKSRELEVASRHKSEFLANMSHEIRTPMNAIIGMSDVLWESSLAPEQREYVRILRNAGDSLLSLINDILDLSKIESGHLDLAEIEFALDELLSSLLEMNAPRAHTKGLELACHVAQDVPTSLVGDPDRLRQILVNLVGNAIKFTDEGEVVLAVEVAREPIDGHCTLEFSVRDTGIGIPEDKRGAIFEGFTQADSSTTRKYGGTGLGLTISRQLVELMGGEIWVESAVGEGSTFHFTAALMVQAPAAHREAVSRDLQGLRCLVVDDNATNRFIVREMLTDVGVAVREATGAEQGIAELRRAHAAGEPYQLVLLDGHMPVIDGFSAAQLIRGDPTLTDTIVMMLTSDRRVGDIERCRELGVRSHLVKPIKRSELFDAIAGALRAVEPAIEARATVPTAVPRKERRLRILMAEDMLDNRILLELYLRDSPHTIDMAENGRIAVAKFEANSYDLVLMDVQMPIMDGYEATRSIREVERKKGLEPVPIIALTAYALKEEIQKSLQAGCTGHLAKPIKKQALLNAIAEHAEGAASQESSDGADRWESRIVIRIDPDLEDLIPDYLDRRREDLASMREAVEQGDYETVRILGHSMKGSGAGFGFDELTVMGGSLEQAAQRADWEAIRSWLGELSLYLERVELRGATREGAE